VACDPTSRAYLLRATRGAGRLKGLPPGCFQHLGRADDAFGEEVLAAGVAGEGAEALLGEDFTVVQIDWGEFPQSVAKPKPGPPTVRAS